MTMKPVRPRDTNLFEHDDQERILGEIPRSNIGLVFIVINAVFLTALILGILFMVAKNETGILESFDVSADFDLAGVMAVVFMVVITLILAGALLGGYIYINSYIILTDQKLILINTKGIFARRVSQLSIGDVQDVSVDQNTLLSRLFNYGNINIETAGEQAHFVFSYADKPNDNAKFIVEAHEQNLKLYGN